MNVSRETSLSKLLSSIANKLNIDQNVFYTNTAFSGLTHSAASLILLAINSVYTKPVLAVSETGVLAERIYLTCYNLVPNKTAVFSELTTKDCDVPGFNLENERYRSEAVNFFRKNKSGIIFTSLSAANEPAIDKTTNKEASFVLTINKVPDRQVLLDALIRWGYEQTDHTETPKTFSIRGGILDIFLPYAANPTRIEFFGNKVESIRIFNPRSQRTIKNIDRIEILPPPNKNISPRDKISLISSLENRFNIIHIYENAGLLSIHFSKNNDNDINLNCKNIKLSDKDISDNDISLNTILKMPKPHNKILFSNNINAATIVDKFKLESFIPINNTLEKGFYSKDMNLCCLSFSELNNQKPVYRSRWTVNSVAEIPQKELSSLEDLDWGDYLVHQDFGIGLYRGLKTLLTHDKVNQECIKIEYADNSNVYVPIDKFSRVHRMIVTSDKEPKLSTLNSPKWTRQKQIAKESARAVVQDLVSLYSSRSRKRGFKYNNNNGFMRELEASFPYEETPGQTAAIEAVFSDMENEFPVDRLICGDVGFGKTEVALRAALKAITSGKKVLFLTPTTILADQHFISTKERLEPLGVQIELLSRFKTKKQQQEILEKMLIGKADLVIGTHRLLSKDVNFPDLGLLIIDEEHRFGVKHKEKLRHLRRSTVDVLTLTATPIPRTLQQSLLGIRDISHINTPPKMRRPIKTFVHFFNWTNIKDVVNNELARGGQVYFLHNEISSIPFILKKLIGLFPNHITGVAHAKMNSRDLESTVLAFFAGSIDILLCTTIIESGLDVSNANTIIINNAQNFGLSQLYQIRGRVGRSYRQAYCYLLLPHGKTIGKSAHKRLKAIEHFTSLGSGYDLSLKDLEIRGAGNLFGYKQSGNIAAVGFEMYCKLLQEAVDESLGNTDTPQPPKISMPIDAMLDSKYVSLVQDRLYFYQQLSEAHNVEAVSNVEAELRDRFGRLPKSTKNLMYITKLRARLSGTAVTSVSVVGSGLTISLANFSPFASVQGLFSAVGEKMTINYFNYQFSPSKNGFSVSVKTDSPQHSFKAIELFVALFSK